MIFGFENEEIMGKTIGEPITYRQLVELDAVTPYEIVLLSVRKEEIKQYINQNEWVRSFGYFDDEERQTRFIASVIALDKAYKRGVSKRVISFHSRNSHAENFEKAVITLKDNKKFASFGELDFIGRCIGGKATENKVMLDIMSEASTGLISNARVLTEGISIPAIDSVIFCDPKRSIVDQVQGISRAIRKYVGKEMARVIMPVIIDSDGSIEQESYQYMVEVMSQLAEFDEVLWDEIQVAVASAGRTRITTNRVVNTDEIEYEDISIDDFYDNLSLAFYTRYKSQNDFWDNEERLKQYCDEAESKQDLSRIDAARRRLVANDYYYWKKFASRFELPYKKLSWEEKLEEAKNIALNFKGSYEQFRQEHIDVVGEFTNIANRKDSPFESGSELIELYTSHMPREKFSYKTTNSKFIIDNMLSPYTTKREVRENNKNSLVMALKKWDHLQEAFEYYNNMESTSTGLKLGQRRGGGWKHK